MEVQALSEELERSIDDLDQHRIALSEAIDVHQCELEERERVGRELEHTEDALAASTKRIAQLEAELRVAKSDKAKADDATRQMMEKLRSVETKLSKYEPPRRPGAARDEPPMLENISTQIETLSEFVRSEFVAYRQLVNNSLILTTARAPAPVLSAHVLSALLAQGLLNKKQPSLDLSTIQPIPPVTQTVDDAKKGEGRVGAVSTVPKNGEASKAEEASKKKEDAPRRTRAAAKEDAPSLQIVPVPAAPVSTKRKLFEAADTEQEKKKKVVHTATTMTKEAKAQRQIQEELEAILIFKFNYYYSRYRLQHTSTNADEKKCLELMAKYKAVSEVRQDVHNENPSSDSQKALHLLKREMIEEKREWVESLRTPDFEACRKALFQREEFERKRIRDAVPKAKFVDEIIPDDLKEKWAVVKEKFIKLYYYWDGFRTGFSMDCFVSYMDHCEASLFNKILEAAKGATLKPPEKIRFKLPMIGGEIPDEEAIQREVVECADWLEKNDRPNRSKAAILERVYKAYGLIPPKPRSRFK